MKLYENFNGLVLMDSLSLDSNNGYKEYKEIFVMKDLFPFDYVLLK